MRFSIGEQLGAMIAHFEFELSSDIDNLEALQKLAYASEAFRNFSMGSLPDFQEDYRRGYDAVCRDLKAADAQAQRQFEERQDVRPGSSPPDLSSGPS